jgi:TatD DNase family protein
MLIDTHCHLYFESFDGDRSEVLARMAQAGVTGAILPAVDMQTALQARELCALHPQLRYAVGWHPGYEPSAQYMAGGRFDARAFLEPLCDATPRPIAIGEIGLDGREGVNQMPLQLDMFSAQMAYARERDLPAIIHLRDAEPEMLAALEQAAGARGVFHCFGGSLAVLDYAVRQRWFVSFAGNLTFPKAQALREAALHTPLELLLVETDAPFLAPQPVRGKRCEPAHVVHTATFLAQLRGMDFDAMCALLTENAQHCFGEVGV